MPASVARTRGSRAALFVSTVALLTGLGVGLGAPGAQALTPAGVGGPVAASTSLPDPTALGPLAITQVRYVGGPTVVTDPKGVTYPAEISGDASYPAKGQPGGPYPVILLLHGNHGTCTIGGSDLTGYPCPQASPVLAPIPSYAGYQQLAGNLASHGYIVLSLDANAVNTVNVTGDYGVNERDQLLERTLDLVAARNLAGATVAPISTTGDSDAMGADLVGRVDMTRIGMMGHSRGGEAVDAEIEHLKARTDGPTYSGALKAVVSLAGTDYSTPVTTGTNLATILPLCDGDVYDLQSVFASDRSHLTDLATPYARTVWTIKGTNHDYFNTVWGNPQGQAADAGDDYAVSADGTTDPACDRSNPANTRLDGVDQRNVGYALIEAYLRRYVGNETAFDPYVTGAAPLPASACPTQVGRSCEDLVKTSYLAPGAARTFIGPARAATTANPLAVTDQGVALTATGWSTFSYCDPHADTGTDGANRDAGTNSGCPTNPERSRTRQWTLAWNSPTGLLRLPLPASAVPPVTASATGAAVLELRAAPNYLDTRTPAGGPDLDVSLVDSLGKHAAVAVSSVSTALVPPDGTTNREQTMDGIRIPLADFPGVDLTRLTAIEITPNSPTGSVEVSDVVIQREAVAADVAAVNLPEAPYAVLFPLVAGAAILTVRVSRRHRATS